MRRSTVTGLAGALALLTVVLPVHADDTTIKAAAVWQGQGRFYKATDTLALFSGYFEGLMAVENKQGDLDAASMICPAMLEVHLTDGTQQGGAAALSSHATETASTPVGAALGPISRVVPGLSLLAVAPASSVALQGRALSSCVARSPSISPRSQKAVSQRTSPARRHGRR